MILFGSYYGPLSIYEITDWIGLLDSFGRCFGIRRGDHRAPKLDKLYELYELYDLQKRKRKESRLWYLVVLLDYTDLVGVFFPPPTKCWNLKVTPES